MKFGHCKNVLNEWDFERVLNETYFECVHCHQPIEERWKRWMNDRKRRRWRRTNFNAEPNHISFHFSDFLSYDDSVRWGRLAIKWIQSKGDPAKRDSYRCDHEGLPVEVHETKTEISDLLLLCGGYKRGFIPWFPRALILGADVGQVYVKWGIYAFRNSPDGGEGECAVIDWGKDLHPNDVALRMSTLEYHCLETGKKYRPSLGVMDAKYRKIEVHRACLRLPRRLFPSAGIRAGLSMRSISFNHVPQRPAWFGIVVYNDDDAKGELYTDRIGAWSRYLNPKTARGPEGRTSPHRPAVASRRRPVQRALRRQTRWRQERQLPRRAHPRAQHRAGERPLRVEAQRRKRRRRPHESRVRHLALLHPARSRRARPAKTVTRSAGQRRDSGRDRRRVKKRC
jgi:hypothetical protein